MKCKCGHEMQAIHTLADVAAGRDHYWCIECGVRTLSGAVEERIWIYPNIRAENKRLKEEKEKILDDAVQSIASSALTLMR